MFVVGLPLLSLSRIALMLWQSERVAAGGEWMWMLVQGVRVDVIQLCLLAAPLVLVAPLLAHRRTWPAWRWLGAAWVAASLTLLVFMELATPAFISEYDTRPNRLFVEYLQYPREVLPTLWYGFRLHVIAGVLVTLVAAWAFLRMLRSWGAPSQGWSGWRVWLSWPLIVLLVAFGIRSTLDHRPANPAMFAFTDDTMVNTLVLNSTWSVAHAIYGLRHESRSSEIYGKLSDEEIVEELRQARALLGDDRPLVADSGLPTLTRQMATQVRERPLNLVIVLEESLGATFVESLGGIPVTPELEKLKSQGWWFERMFATGTRSVRGIEAVVAGFPPTPAQSTVKLSLSQRGFFTLAELLRERGYATEFIYGGESHFDNMRSFFLGNGFQTVIDQDDYAAPVFRGSWGVSDEDLFARTHERISAQHASGRSFFTLVFTSSNHAPFQYPDGRIELHDADKATENNAVKYADHALGRFLEQARESAYWQDTVFLIVADHDIRVRGDTLVPIERFHIPALILGADVEPRRVTTVASQIDLAPTVLSLMGIDADHPMPGRDLTREPSGLAGRAMMQFEQNYGWMEGDEVVVLRPGKPPTHGRYDFATKRLEVVAAPPPDAEARERRALAHVLLPAWLYREQLYRGRPSGAAVLAAR
ncbi:MAG TPA: LTA synthase family protein [Rhodocyclaceae bacterium]|nr:LTA synthase family protein [Rhodocyclaceae bacterium]